MIGEHADHRPTDYRFERQRADRLYIPLQRSKPPFPTWRGDILAAVIVIACAPLMFIVARLLVDLMGRMP